MEIERARYLLRYYDYLMTDSEKSAERHLSATAKATHGRTDATAQAQVRASSHHLRKMLSDDPEVLQLASDGLDAFALRTAKKMLALYGNQIAFNCCPRCGALAKTPKARRCRFGKYDWHRADSQLQPSRPPDAK